MQSVIGYLNIMFVIVHHSRRHKKLSILCGIIALCVWPAYADEGHSFFTFKDLRLNIFSNRDSDTIRTRTTELTALGRLNKADLNFGITALRTDAHQNSGLRAGDVGGGKVKYYKPWAGLRFSSYKTLNIDLKLGYETTNTDGQSAYWVGGLDGYFFDALYARIYADHSLYAVSPLAISRDVESTVYGAEANLDVTDRFSIGGSLDHTRFSDDNSRWRGTIAPAFLVAKTDTADFLLGLKALYFKFDKDLSNGYYDPQEAQKYLLTYGINIDEPGYGRWTFSGAAGQRKDERIGEFDYAVEFNAAGSFTLHPGIDLGFLASALREGGGSFLPYWWHELGLNVMARF